MDGILYLVHGYLYVPITQAPCSKSYFLLLVNDHNRFMWLSLLSKKSDTLEAIQIFQLKVEVETGRWLRVLRTDHGGEFTLVAFEEHWTKHGVHRQQSVPYTPKQNGVAERQNQTTITMACSLLKGRRLSVVFFGEAVTTTVFLLNRTSTKRVAGKTLFEAWYGRKPDVTFLRTFGFVAHVKMAHPHAWKLNDRSSPMVFICYEPGAKAWRFYDPAARRVHILRDVVFRNTRVWNGARRTAVRCNPPSSSTSTTLWRKPLQQR